MITKKRVGVLAGGTSAERDVSLRSGDAVYKALIGLGYDAVFIDVSDTVYSTLLEKRVDIAFVLLHGGHGENGAIQGLLEVMGIPYTGSGILASALAMDRAASKMTFISHGIPVAPFLVVRRKEVENRGRINIQAITTITEFPLPWVVKPATKGASIGVSVVRLEEQIERALKEAFEHGDRALIESYIRGKEIQIGVLGDKVLGGVEVRPLREFYDYEASHAPESLNCLLPPEIGRSKYGTIKAFALQAHKALGCKGATRVDFVLDESHHPFLLAVNTIPGMTETSLLPKIAHLAGVEFPALVEKILASALIE